MLGSGGELPSVHVKGTPGSGFTFMAQGGEPVIVENPEAGGSPEMGVSATQTAASHPGPAPYS